MNAKGAKKECFIYENDRPLSSCFAVTHRGWRRWPDNFHPRERWATRMKWIMKTNFRSSLLLMMDKLRSSRGRVVGQREEKILESQQAQTACQRRHQHSIGHRSTVVFIMHKNQHSSKTNRKREKWKVQKFFRHLMRRRDDWSWALMSV